jgi:hypothetical protein
MTIRRKVPVYLALISIALLAVVATTSRVLLLDASCTWKSARCI